MASDQQTIIVNSGNESGKRLDKTLASLIPPDTQLSRSRLSQLIKSGAVSRNGVPVTSPSAKVMPGEVWRIVLAAAVESGLRAENLPLELIFEDEELIVLNKAAGMVVHPGAGNRNGTLVNALLFHCGSDLPGIGGERQPGIVHRLDKDTSGIMVVAKTDRAMRKLTAQFEDRSISRTYQAVVKGVPSRFPRLHPDASCDAKGEIRIENRIGRHRTNRLKQAVVTRGGRLASTIVSVLEPFATRSSSLVECRLETGRTHQIRVHLTHIGHPVIGDPMYGRGSRLLPREAGTTAQSAVLGFSRQALHAVKLKFKHPASDKFVEFDAPLPPDITRLIEVLR